MMSHSNSLACPVEGAESALEELQAISDDLAQSPGAQEGDADRD